jgi:hypothetical protein
MALSETEILLLISNLSSGLDNHIQYQLDFIAEERASCVPCKLDGLKFGSTIIKMPSVFLFATNVLESWTKIASHLLGSAG